MAWRGVAYCLFPIACQLPIEVGTQARTRTLACLQGPSGLRCTPHHVLRHRPAMAALLYECPERKPGWRFTARLTYPCSSSCRSKNSALFDDISEKLTMFNQWTTYINEICSEQIQDHIEMINFCRVWATEDHEMESYITRQLGHIFLKKW